jgi:branched-chain amino acid aminotransferase
MGAFGIPNTWLYMSVPGFRYNAAGGSVAKAWTGASVIHRFVFHNEELKTVDKVRWSLAVREHGRHAASPLAGVKTTSWLSSVWAVAEAQREGFDEVVLLNERGEVSECTAANIFAVKGDKVLTPPLNSGCLEGVTRGVLSEVAAEAGTSVVEQTLRLDDLYSADEVFITSTNRNVIGIREIAGRKIGNGTTGAVTKRLDLAFDAFVNDYVSRRLAANR